MLNRIKKTKVQGVYCLRFVSEKLLTVVPGQYKINMIEGL